MRSDNPKWNENWIGLGHGQKQMFSMDFPFSLSQMFANKQCITQNELF